MPTPPLDRRLHKAILRLYRRGYTVQEIARRLGLATGTVSKYRRLRLSVNSGDKANDVDDVEAAVVAEDPVQKQRQSEEERRKREEHLRAVRELSFRRFLTELVHDAVQPLACQPPPPTPQKPNGHVRHPLLVFTDWHFEERVSSEGTLGLNSYDIPTACRRVWRVVQALRDWKSDFESGGRFTADELVVVCLGDFVTGTLHGLERKSDAPNVVRATLACGDLLALALADLAASFRSIRVYGVPGNHGRLPDDKRTPTKDPTRSWDFLVYEVARRRLNSCQNITWELPDSYSLLFNVGGHLCYAAHGNFIPNNLGVVGHGVRRFTTSVATNLQAAGKPLRYAFFGHWHAVNSSEFAGLEAFICPALIGTQEYGFLTGMGTSRSAQSLFIFDDSLGLCGYERLYGDGPGYKGTYQVSV